MEYNVGYKRVEQVLRRNYTPPPHHNYDFTIGFERNTMILYERRIKNKRDKNQIRRTMETYVHIHWVGF